MKKSITQDIKENGLDVIGRYENIVSFTSKEMIDKVNHSADIKIIRVIDNVKTPELSVSKKCQCNTCNKRIRYEYIISKDKEEIAYGFNCVCDVMGLNAAKVKQLKKVSDIMAKEAEINDWLDKMGTYKEYKVSNRKVIEKLHELHKSGLLVFEPYYIISKIEPLCEDDLKYIWFTNKEKTREHAEMAKNLDVMMNSEDNKYRLDELQSLYIRLQLNKDLLPWQQEKYNECSSKVGADQKCPKCGGNLVLRKSKYGVFLGCVNYIKGCNYTKNVEGINPKANEN